MKYIIFSPTHPHTHFRLISDRSAIVEPQKKLYNKAMWRERVERDGVRRGGGGAEIQLSHIQIHKYIQKEGEGE